MPVEKSDGSDLTPEARVRDAWSRVSAELPDLRQFLTEDLAADTAVECLLVDAEARWARALPATVEHYDATLPGFRQLAGAVRALLFAEIVRRPDVPPEELRRELRDRLPGDGDLIDLCVDVCAQLREPGPGSRLGPYVLERAIGRGSFATVWMALDERLQRRVALKLLRPDERHEEELATTALAEARAAAGVRHPNVVTVHAVGTFEESGLHYIDSDLVGDPQPTAEDPLAIAVGSPLTEFAVRDHRPTLSVPVMAALLRDVARAVSAAHVRGIVHRDIKPANIVVTPSGRPVVTDFGISLSTFPALASPDESAPRTFDHRIAGTPAFMSPEQAAGDPSTALTDVFGLGGTLAYVLTGRPPHPAQTTVEAAIRQARWGELTPIPTECDARLAAIARKALEREPRFRYASAELMAKDLDAVARKYPTSFEGRGLRAQLRWLVRRRPYALAATALLLAGLAIFTTLALRERDRRVAMEQDRALELLLTSGEFWPRRSSQQPAMDAWSTRARSLLAALPETHPGVTRLTDALRAVDSQRAAIDDVASRSREGWDECLRDLGNDPRFGTALMRPIVGLIPLGRDRTSGLWEFWQLESGERPAWIGSRNSGQCDSPERGGIVMVLLPGGTVRGRSTDPPCRLSPFLLAKYEFTQAQALAIWGRNPSEFHPGSALAAVTLRHPLEMVSRSECERLAQRLELVLPTRMQWLYARRCGREASATDAAEAGNLRDLAWARAYSSDATDLEPDDGWPLHAPVGRFGPNPWGLCDLIGNVWEWVSDPFTREPSCRDGDGLDTGASPEHARAMGGGFSASLGEAVSDRGGKLNPDYRSHYLGFRPARNLDAH